MSHTLPNLDTTTPPTSDEEWDEQQRILQAEFVMLQAEMARLAKKQVAALATLVPNQYFMVINFSISAHQQHAKPRKKSYRYPPKKSFRNQHPRRKDAA